MSIRIALIVIVLATCGMTGCTEGTQADEARQPVDAAASGGKANQGKAAYLQCAACHALTPDSGAKVGPSLAGVVDRAAGSAPDYQYSEAMAKSGITWTREELDAFIAAPSTKVPGSKMVFAGIEDAARREALIEYLADPESKAAP